ncbi:methyl-accepting chemotaxis protein [Paenalcaligenes hominis]|uniref:methyl-accepting chemotaxis protein n=1 Tax=Paenalcaligenes hominis TaxID=643674 RepID=UPI00352550A6
MRINTPITPEQVEVPKNHYLISKTDLKGRITYVNPLFEQISGFSVDELVGQSHNIVRHPHMPPSVYRDMWQRINKGQQWQGIIKNRCKNGAFYWVHARIIPIIEDGQHTGFASIRVRASEQQIRAAEQRYAPFKENPNHDTVVKNRPLAERLKQARHLFFGNNYRSHLLRFTSLFSALVMGAYYAGTHYSTTPGILAGLGLALIALLAYGWNITQKLLHTLAESTHIAQQIAIGNLNTRVDYRRTVFESRQLYFFLEHMRGSLRSVITDSSRAVHASRRVAAELYQSSDHLAQRTNEQLSALHQTQERSLALSQLVATSVDQAQEASTLATSTQQAANQGGQDVQAVVHTMQDLHQKSRQIADITTVIEGIAFQTNILALNAAVESARAGEAGRGFAVVANEVRNLALRSTQAAQEIKSLLEDNQHQIQTGVQQAEQAGHSMQHILHAIQNVQRTIQTINQSNLNQEHGLNELQTALKNLEDLSQQNHTLVATLHRTVSDLGQQNQNMHHAIAALGA